MHENKVQIWLNDRIKRFRDKFLKNTDWSLVEQIRELRAIADEAEMRLKNPNFPSSEGDIEF